MFFKKIFKSNKAEIKQLTGDVVFKQAMSDYTANKDEFEVIKKIKLALELGVEHYTLDQLYLYLGLAYRDINDIDEAIKYLEQGNAINPSNSKIVTNLGPLYEKLGKPEIEYNLYYESLKLIPENAVLYNNIGVYYYRKGLHIKALEYFDIAIQFNSTLVNAYANKARSLAYIGNYEDANKFAKIAKLRDYDDFNELVTDIQDIKINNPKIYFNRNKFIEFVIALSNNDTDLMDTIFNIIDLPLEYYKEHESELESKLYTSFEIKNTLHILYLIEYLVKDNKILIFDNSENNTQIINSLDKLIKQQIYIDEDFFSDFLENKDDYNIIDLLTAIATKLKLLYKYELLDIWSNEYNYNIVILDSEKWAKIQYPYTFDLYGVGVIRNLATNGFY